LGAAAAGYYHVPPVNNTVNDTTASGRRVQHLRGRTTGRNAGHRPHHGPNGTTGRLKERDEARMRKLRWGVIGVAKIAVEKVIPAMQGSELTEVIAVASRDRNKALAAADELGLAKAYGSYEELLDDPDIDAVYNPLPNHLHKEWTIAAAERGKHVLCEKPIGMSAGECEELIATRDRTGVKIQEAFMVRTHPQWLAARELVRSGRIGTLRAIGGHFSYFNDDPANVRNVLDWGGGALMDVGCYPITVSRFLFEAEPLRVMGLVERDPRFGTDRLTSALLDFAAGQGVFTCSTQLVPCQRVQLFGTAGRIELEIPFNAPNDRPCRIFVDDGGDLFGAGVQALSFDTCDQYTIQADLFSRAIRDGRPAPLPLEDSVLNMRVIEALFRSARSGSWEAP
jgi:predicted dehydrogenase